MRIDGLLKFSGLPRNCKKPILEMLSALTDKGLLLHLPGGGWALTENTSSITGTYRAASGGGGNFVPDSPLLEPFPIHQLHDHDAWNGDKVRAIPPGKNIKNGRIIEIIKRENEELVARVDKKQGNNYLCVPADRKLPLAFLISVSSVDIDGESPFENAMILIRPSKKLNNNLWQADLVKVFGLDDKIEVQEAVVKAMHKAPAKFPSLALEQASKLANEIPDASGREDLRHIPFITIDGKDAKDFDDAIFVTRQGDEWLLLVAIADVSHYVRPDNRPGSLDSEALKRGNSWYFPQSVEPMLPEELSNGLCSLRPGEDRYVMLAEVRLSKDGKPIETRFAPAIIRSHGRLVYDDVAAFLKDDKNKPAYEPPIGEMLHDANELYKILARRRRKEGTLDFDLPEPAYSFNEDGSLKKMSIAERNDAHKMIEEFMICANEAVARHIGNSGIPFLYRVHPEPEAEKLAVLAETLEKVGLDGVAKIKGKDGLPEPGALQEVLRSAAGTEQEYLVNKLCLRAMQQARYQPDNVGHFGLASPSYCHFTSPIRRYADLLVHRALKKSLQKSTEKLPDHDSLLVIGDQLNSLERSAIDCERDMARRLGCAALKEHIGEILPGTISGVTEFGAFVEFSDIPTEGLIRLPDFGNDWYEFDAKTQSLRGMRTGKTWRLGQPVKVRVEDVNTDKMEIRLTPEGVEPRSNLTLSHSGKMASKVGGHGKNKRQFKDRAQRRKKDSSAKSRSAGREKPKIRRQSD